MDKANRKRPLADQEIYDAPRSGDWELALVDDPTTWPQPGDYGYGCLHCTLITPKADFIQTGHYEYIEPQEKRMFCRPWTGAADDFEEGTRVWVREYHGFTHVMLAACAPEWLTGVEP